MRELQESRKDEEQRPKLRKMPRQNPRCFKGQYRNYAVLRHGGKLCAVHRHDGRCAGCRNRLGKHESVSGIKRCENHTADDEAIESN